MSRCVQTFYWYCILFISSCHNKTPVPMMLCLFGCHCNQETWWVWLQKALFCLCSLPVCVRACVSVLHYTKQTNMYTHKQTHTPQWGYPGLCNVSLLINHRDRLGNDNPSLCFHPCGLNASLPGVIPTRKGLLFQLYEDQRWGSTRAARNCQGPHKIVLSYLGADTICIAIQ